MEGRGGGVHGSFWQRFIHMTYKWCSVFIKCVICAYVQALFSEILSVCVSLIWFVHSAYVPLRPQQDVNGCVFWPWVRVQRQGTVGRRAGGGDGPDAARSLRLLIIIHIEPAYCQDPSLVLSLFLSLFLSLSLPFNLTVPLFLVLSKYPPFYFHLHRCFFHVSAFILSISFICITPSLSILSCISSFSLSVYLFLWRYRWTHLQVNLNSWRCIISILLLPHICSEFSPLP